LNTKKWPILNLGDVVAHRKEFINIDDLKHYKRCRVQLHAKGIVLRDLVEGSSIKTKQQQVCHENELLVAEIDAKVGGFGLVPSELAGAIVSSHYFLFTPKTSKIEPKFLGYYVKTPFFRDQIEAQGSTNYASIRPQQVLSYKIPLPPLAEQRRIVAKIERLAAKIEEIRKLYENVDTKTSILNSIYNKYFNIGQNNNIFLGNIANIIDPNPTHRYPNYLNEGIPIISTSDFKGKDEIEWNFAKKIPNDFYENTLGKYKVQGGDVIFSRKGKIGYARAHPENIKLAMTHTLCVIQPDRKKILPEYLLHFCRSPNFINFLIDTMNKNTGVPTLGLNVIRKAPIKLPEIKYQILLIKEMNDIIYKLEEVQSTKLTIVTELDALLPSILDRAFQGKL
jgi:type I restriction enzyme S subunit